MSATKHDGQRPPKRKRIELPITPDEALQILQSAVNHCQRAGLEVNYATDSANGLTLYLPECKVVAEGETVYFTRADVAS
ncbi:MAG TPA: hypothetical protein VJL59_25950 [Anaerolineales bacterium]|nr:hypothetical protein [Anaerolineales bacterium]